MTLEEYKLDREWLIRYVLGELSHDETRIVDDRFFADDDFAAAIDDAYRDLLDDYAAGTLPAQMATRVQQAFCAGPYQGRQLSILKALETGAAAAPIESHFAAAVPPPTRANFSAQREEATATRSRPWFLNFWPIAISAGVLTAAVALALFINVKKSHTLEDVSNAPAATASASASASPNTKAPPLPSAPPISDLPPVPTRKHTHARRGKFAPAAPVEVAYTVLILPNVVRGDGDDTVFAIPAATTTVHLQIVLSPDQPGDSYEVHLEDSRNHEITHHNAVGVQTLDTERYVEIVVPAAALPTGDYMVDVQPSTAGKRPIQHFVVHISRHL
jgi:anti-sigma-K factor RskA